MMDDDMMDADSDMFKFGRTTVTKELEEGSFDPADGPVFISPSQKCGIGM
jgi:hypothetical protein